MKIVFQKVFLCDYFSGHPSTEFILSEVERLRVTLFVSSSSSLFQRTYREQYFFIGYHFLEAALRHGSLVRLLLPTELIDKLKTTAQCDTLELPRHGVEVTLLYISFSIISQCPPFAGPTRISLFISLNFRMFSSVFRMEIPIFFAISGALMSGFEAMRRRIAF